MELLELLRKEEELQGVKMGYVKYCSRSGDWFWKCEFGDNQQDGMIEDLIGSNKLTDEELEELIEFKCLTHAPSCCDSYYAVAVY